MVEGWEMRESEGRKEVGGEGEEGGNKGEREREEWGRGKGEEEEEKVTRIFLFGALGRFWGGFALSKALNLCTVINAPIE